MNVHDPNVTVYQSEEMALRAARALGFTETVLRVNEHGMSVRLYRNDRFWGVIGTDGRAEKRVLVEIAVKASC